jgi:hypothetical protein
MDGIACRSTGRALAKLQTLGFIEISENGTGSIARLTRSGYAALVLRLRPQMEPRPPRPSANPCKDL